MNKKTCLLIVILGFSFLLGCGQSKENPGQVEGLCPAMARAPIQILVNGTKVQDLANPIVLPVGQNITFTVSYFNNVNCGATDGKEYWIINGGSKVNDRCSTFANPVTGNYTVKFTREGSADGCFATEVETVDFKVQ